MKKRRAYFKTIYKVILVLIAIAVANLFMAIYILDATNYALDGKMDAFYRSAAYLLGIVLLMFPLNLLYAYVKGSFIKDALRSMKRDYLNKVFHKNINEFQKDNNAKYVSALTNDFNIIERDYLEPTVQLIEGIIHFSTGVIIIAMISPIVLLIGFGVILLNIIISMFTSKPVNKHNEERSELFSDYTSYIKEVLSAFNIIKTNNLDDRVKNNFYAKSEKVQSKGYIIDKIMTFIFAIQRFNMNVTFVGIMLIVAYLSINGSITFGGVLVIINNMDKLISPVMHMSESLPKILSVGLIFKRINHSLENSEVFNETLPFEHLSEDIHFQDVTFGYDDNLVLNHVNLHFEKGKKYLVVGPSGGGKSTILKLLRKYYYPQEGHILIDGSEMKHIKKNDYFNKLANIEQQIFLFEDTLRNNLTLYKAYSDEEVWKAIDQAGLRDFVEGHKDGLNRMIVDNGKNISGGEKSRIAIARGLLNRAEIILLDEAFASLDLERAKEIEKSILALQNVTIINVSHVVIEENKSYYDQVIMVKNKSVFVQ